MVDNISAPESAILHRQAKRKLSKTNGYPPDNNRYLGRALIQQFPPEMFDGTFAVGYPSTYIHRTVQSIGHIKTAVPAGTDGDLDLTFKGTKMEVVPFGPPQSALPAVISMNLEQYERLRKLKFIKGGHQEICRRISERAQIKDSQVRAFVLSTDMALIKDAMKRDDVGAWQDLFREIMGDTTGD